MLEISSYSNIIKTSQLWQPWLNLRNLSVRIWNPWKHYKKYHFHVLASNLLSFVKKMNVQTFECFFANFFMKNNKKSSHPKLIQNHFGNVPVTPGHQKKHRFGSNDPKMGNHVDLDLIKSWSVCVHYGFNITSRVFLDRIGDD